MPTVTSRDGTTIAYSRQGQGPALILVDGALCSRNFGPMPGYAAQLANDFTVYWYDRRGRGESGDTTPYAIEREVEDLAAILAVAGLSAYLFGSSSGAALTLQGAARGLEFKKMILYEAPYVPVPQGGKTASQHVEALWALVRAHKRGAAVTYFMSDVVGMPKFVAFFFRFFPMWPKLKAVANTLPYDLTIMADTAILDGEAKSVTVPTLVAGGGKSPPPLKAAVDRVAAAVPGSKVRYLEGETHNLGAEAAAGLMKEFFLNG
jgi:pimeloyl-ACP methyl ester carboxylesterase